MRQKVERKNGGFTLVEILIAITILGIIIVPFMHSFVTASRTNAKAKKLQNATALGTNLMEEIKANSIEELAFQFNYPVKNDEEGNAAGSRFDIMDASSFNSVEEVILDGEEYKSVLKYQKSASGGDNRQYVTSSVLYEGYDPGSSEEYEYLGQSLGKYYFVMRGATSGTGTYDALITMDANAYKTVDDKGYNDQSTPVIGSVDVLQDAFWVQTADMDETYVKKILKEEYGKSDNDALDLLPILRDNNPSNGEMKRCITVDIQKEGTITKVYVTYTYTVYNFEGTSKSVSTEPDLRYTNAESPGYDLRSIYLFYVPNYASNSIGSPVKDQIIVNNPYNVEADLYVVKQKQSSFNTYTYEMLEDTYYCEVSVREDAGSFNISTHNGALSLRTNLNKNIYDENRTLINKYSLIYENKECTQRALSDSAKRILNATSLNAEIVKDRIYDVTVAVYEEGQAAENFSGEPVAVITGSKDN